MPQQRWQLASPQPTVANQLAELTALSPLLTQVLINRGIDQPEVVAEFLNPEAQKLPSPLDEFPDLALSIDLLMEIITSGQKIAICGDYDADGMTSTALLIRALRFLGAKADYAIPSRMVEGYGLNERIVEEFYRDGVGLILTVDNGIAAHAPIARARELGLMVIITDHHDIPPTLPVANAILNPKLLPETSPYRGVAGVGVAYILAVCLAQALERTQDLTAPLLELFTLGTIADLAPLTGVNRRWVRRGLRLLPKSRILGVQALIQVAGLSDQAKPLKPEDIGFKLGPRINAIGRISDPEIVIEMLTTDDVGIALERALQCEQVNQTRRQLCTQIEQEAIAWCETQIAEGHLDLRQERVLVIIQPGWHHGVIGIVASRLVERYGVPVFIGTYEDDAQKEIRGSARGIPEFNVFEALQTCDDLMHKYGGHRAAGGFTFPTKHLRQVKSRLSHYACSQLQPEHLKPLVQIDVEAYLGDLDLELFSQIDQLHPCGIANSEPVFWSTNVQLLEQSTVGQNRDHLKVRLGQLQPDGSRIEIKGIAWRWGEYCPLPDRLDIAYKLKLNEWQGSRTVEVELIGVRPVTTDTIPEKTSTTTDTLSPAPATGTTPASTMATEASNTPASDTALQDSPAKTSPARKSPRLPFEPPSPSRTREATLQKNLGILVEPTTPSSPLPLPPPSPQPPPSPSPSPPPSDLPRADFFYSKRRYTVILASQDQTRELTIDNPEGQRLVVRLPERQGFLCLPGDPPRPVDISEPYYFNLIRAGLGALEMRQKTQLLLEKDELLAEKDRHIQTLTRQIALLEAKLSQLSTDQQQQFHQLQTELQQQESNIQSQEAHIARLQSQLEPEAGLVASQSPQQQARQLVGDKLWFCLSQASQSDLQAAHQGQAGLPADGPGILTDHSEPGLRLAAVVDRELLQPFFQDLRGFLLPQEITEIGSLQLEPSSNYRLEMLPPLLAESWKTYKKNVLQVSDPSVNKTLYSVCKGGRAVASSDRSQITAFLNQWEHPAAQWLSQESKAAAGQIDQISKLCALAAQAETTLHRWHYQQLQQLIMGNGSRPGLLQLIYAL